MLKLRPVNLYSQLRCYTVLTPRSSYDKLVQSGAIHVDKKQNEAIDVMQSLYSNIKQFPHNNSMHGLYFYGGVGIGKTMLMDLFYKCCLPILPNTRRDHFHAFMLDVHNRMHKYRNSPEFRKNKSNAVNYIANQIANETKMLCLDELQVTDIADAAILRSLFGTLFERECMVVATSNRAPNELYKDGFNREIIIPFIKLVEQKCKVIQLDQGVKSVDYRRESQPVFGMYNYPINDQTLLIMKEQLYRHSGNVEPKPIDYTIPETGKRVHIQFGVPKHVCMVSFKELCERDMGSSDYLSLAKLYPTILITDIPQLNVGNSNMSNETRRFIVLIDILYDMRIRVIISAHVPVDTIFKVDVDEEEQKRVDERVDLLKKDRFGRSSTLLSDLNVATGDGTSIGSFTAMRDMLFAFKRTQSRLIEMQGESYTSTCK